MLECERSTQSREGLHFVENHKNIPLVAKLAKRLEVLVRTGVIATFTGNEFEPQASVLARVSIEEPLDSFDSPTGGSLGIGRVEHRKIVDIKRLGHTGSVCRSIGESRERDGTSSETVVDADHSRSWCAIVECDLQRVFVGHGSTGTQ